MEKKYKYDIALSFAGEQRAYVEELALYLKKIILAFFMIILNRLIYGEKT